MKNTLRALRITVALMLCLSLAVVTMAQGARGSLSAPATVSVTTTATSLKASNPRRSKIIIWNVGAATVYLGNASTVTSATGIPLPPNCVLVDGITNGAYYGITGSSTADVRVAEVQDAPPTGDFSISRLVTSGISNNAAANHIPVSDGANMVEGNAQLVDLTSAITPNSTTTSLAAGTFGVTSNATGLGVLFQSDGTNWQLMPLYADRSSETDSVTIATTGNTDAYVLAPFTGKVIGVDYSGTDALTANDTNYVTFSITNLAQNGSGSNPLLAATAANTTQATGGSGIAANTKRSLTLNGTASNLLVTAGDRLRVRFAATGTLANTVTFSKVVIRFTRLS